MIDKIVNKLKVSKWKPSKVLNTIERIKKKKFKGFDSNMSLKDIEDYSFLKNWEYKNILNFIWDVKLRNLIWEWFNWIVVDHPIKEDYIVKVAKPNTFDLIEERNTHDLFRKKIDDLKSQDNSFDNIYVPNIFSNKWDILNYQMEKIEWLNFTSIFYLEHYKDLFKNYNQSKVNELNDNEIKLLIIEKWFPVIECSDKINTWIEDKLLTKKYEWWWNKKQLELGIDKVFKTLEEEGFIHWDWHWWNIMKDKNWKIYLIDFWTSEVLNYK